MAPRDLSHRKAFEDQGETYVRLLAQKDDDTGRQARAWLAEKQAEREAERDRLLRLSVAIGTVTAAATTLTAIAAALALFI